MSNIPKMGHLMTHVECLPKNWNVFRRKRNEEITSEGAKDNERMSQRINQVCNASHFQKLWFVRFPAFGAISGQHLECVQRFLFALFHSNFLVQLPSNSIFWLKEPDFGLDK